MSTPRNPTNARHQCTFRLPADLVDRISEEATARLVGRSKLVELLLTRALRDLPGLTTGGDPAPHGSPGWGHWPGAVAVHPTEETDDE